MDVIEKVTEASTSKNYSFEDRMRKAILETIREISERYFENMCSKYRYDSSCNGCNICDRNMEIFRAEHTSARIIEGVFLSMKKSEKALEVLEKLLEVLDKEVYVGKE